jgi:hypothetical protein
LSSVLEQANLPCMYYTIIVCPDTVIFIETDLYYEVVHAHTRGPLTARPTCTHWDIEIECLSIRGNKQSDQ